MADFEMPGDDDIFVKVQADLSAKSIEITARPSAASWSICR